MKESGERLIERWQDANRVYHFEGSTTNLEKLVRDIGYRADAFGSAIENFLIDNPGAQNAIVDWISEWIDRNSDWHDLLTQELGPDPDDTTEEEDE